MESRVKMKMIKSIAGMFLFTCLVTIRPAQTYDTVNNPPQVAGRANSVLRAQLVVLFQKAQQSAALLEVNPSDEKERKLIGKLAQDVKNIEAEAQNNGFDIQDGVEEIRSIIRSIPGKPKKRKVEEPSASSSNEPEKIHVSQLPALPLEPNSFGPQVQLPHQGEPLRKHVAGLLTYFPYEVSPMRGIILSSNGSLKKQWQLALQSGRTVSPLMKKLFNYQDGQILKTHLGGNPVMGLSPEIIGQLVRIMVIDSALLLKLDDAFFKNWHASYMATPMPEANRQLKKYTEHFKKEAKDFLKILKESVAHENGKQDAIDLLLSYMMMSVEDAGIVATEYANGLAIPFEPLYYTDQDYEQAKNDVFTMSCTTESVKPFLEQLVFVATAQTGLRSYLTSDSGYAIYQNNSFSICKEVVIRKLLALILYNPSTSKLDLNMLPQNIQQTVSEQLKQFVCMYGDKPADDRQVVKAFLDLVENKVAEGIYYKSGTYEITGDISNCTAILRILFGIKNNFQGSARDQFEEVLALLFNNGQRSISADYDKNPLVHDEEFEYNFIIRNRADGDFVRIVIEWDDEHGLMDVVLPGDTCAAQVVSNVYYAGIALDTFLLGLYGMSLPRMLYFLEAESILEIEDDFIKFFSSYSSQFTKKIPEAFNTTQLEWQFFFENAIDQAAMAVVEAAVNTGLDLGSEEGLLVEALEVFCQEGNFRLVKKICNHIMNPTEYLFTQISGSHLSCKQKQYLVEKFLKRGLFSQDIYEILQVLDQESIDLLPQGEFGINRIDEKGNSLSILALTHYDFKGFLLLFEHAADLDIRNLEGMNFYDILLKQLSEMKEFLKKPITIEEYQAAQGYGPCRSIKDKIDVLLELVQFMLDADSATVRADEKKRISDAYKDFSKTYRDFKKELLQPILK